MSPTQRTLKCLRDEGLGNALVQVTEHWNGFARIRQDLFHFVDVLAITFEGQTCAYQVTSGSNVSARVKKITQDHAMTLAALKRAGWRVFVHGWSKKKKKKGGVATHHVLREIEL